MHMLNAPIPCCCQLETESDVPRLGGSCRPDHWSDDGIALYIINSNILFSSLFFTFAHTYQSTLRLLSLQKHQFHGILSDYTATHTNGSVSDPVCFRTNSLTDHSFVQLDWAIYSNH